METIQVVRVAEWARFEWLRHGFTTRFGGLSTVFGGQDLSLGVTKDDDPNLVAENRKLALQATAESDEFRLKAVLQVHGMQMVGVTPEDDLTTVEADGMVTAAAGLMLGVKVADCVPVLLADTRQRVVAAIHAGWRGTAAGIVEHGVATMREAFGSRAEDLVGAVGPSIGACCYTVGEEVRTAFRVRFAYAEELFAHGPEGLRVDLWEANRRQMLSAGVSPKRISVIGECTACTRVDGRRKYFSHRAEKGFTGRAMGMIGVAAR